jgi:hypothetical protein
MDNDNTSYQNAWYNSTGTYVYDDRKCECGSHKTYGKDCPKDYHSDWCILSPNYVDKKFVEDTMSYKTMFGEFHD